MEAFLCDTATERLTGHGPSHTQTVVACWQWALNHSRTNWEDPFAYKPERFVEGSKNTKDRVEALQPFSVGPRNCIGRK